MEQQHADRRQARDRLLLAENAMIDAKLTRDPAKIDAARKQLDDARKHYMDAYDLLSMIVDPE